MMSTPASRSNKFPFTATQWQELEHQALIYKYMVAGIPIPPDLLFSINRNLDPSLSSKLFPTYQTSPIGWNPYQMAYGGKKIDPEPGRCRRTDGKKWRCSKEAYPDSKYCERHMHRGKNRSRKPVEVMAAAAAAATGVNHNQAAAAMLPGNTPIISPSFSVSKLQNANSSSSSSSFHPLQSTYQSASDTSFHYGGRCHGNSSFDSNFLYPHSSSSRPPGGTDQDSILYDSASFSRDRYLHGVKEDVAVGEHAFFTESSGAARRDMQSGYPNYVDDMSSKQKQAWGREFGSCEASSMEEVKREISEPRKTIHHFFDEWPPKGSRDSSPWHDSSTTQLSISIPTSSHDLFLSASTPHNDG